MLGKALPSVSKVVKRGQGGNSGKKYRNSGAMNPQTIQAIAMAGAAIQAKK